MGAKIKTPCKKKFKFPDASGTKTVLSNICLLTCRNCPSASPTKVPSKLSSESPTETPTELPTKVPSKLSSESPTEIPTESPTESPTKTPTESPTKSPTEGSACKDNGDFTFSYEADGKTVTSCAELTSELKKWAKIKTPCKKKFK